jgi:Ca2+-dependent lipid-binding protein
MQLLGASDPYCKFCIDGKTLYKSRIVYKTLNPKWDETFTLPVDDLGKVITVKVYDYDRGRKDDYMGSATIEVSTLELNA